MSTAAAISVAEPRLPAGIPDVPVWKMSVEQYESLLSNGILKDGDPIELLDGWLVPKMTKNPPHTVCVGLLTDALSAVLPSGWHLRNQEPVTLARSVPEPDLAVVTGIRRDYVDRHPVADEIAVLVEVADATLEQDRGLKLRVYAESGIREYWLVDLASECITVLTEPNRTIANPRFDKIQVYRRADSIPLPEMLAPNEMIPVADLLP